MVGAALFSIPIIMQMGLPIWATVVLNILCVIVGIIEKFAYAPLRNSPRISSLITAIGVSLLAIKFIGANSLPFPRIFGTRY